MYQKWIYKNMSSLFAWLAGCKWKGEITRDRTTVCNINGKRKEEALRDRERCRGRKLEERVKRHCCCSPWILAAAKLRPTALHKRLNSNCQH